VEYFLYFGFKKQCPICGKKVNKFAPSGVIKRKNAKCIWCGSLERHRLIWLFLSRETDFFKYQNKKILHFAPENEFRKKFSNLFGKNYITADLYNPAMLKIDITDTKLPDNYFDIILCSHVLEHIIDDKLAIMEMSRILKNDGWALIVVPITVNSTFEDKNISTPELRQKYFGQFDHVRRCGLDYKERIENNGFFVKEYKTEEITNSYEQNYYGLIKGEIIYYCKKNKFSQN